MSLGPPFDASGERTQLGVGAATSVVVIAAVAIALLASDRSLGESVSLHISMRTPGALRNGAHVRLAGQKVGEVVAMRGVGWRAKAHKGGGEPLGVELEVRLLRAYQRYVYRNSVFFAHSENVLTEAGLEIGPPRGGAAPDRMVENGEHLRGADPPDMDRFLEKVHDSLRGTLAVAHELQPDWDAFRHSFSGLLSTMDGLAEPGVVARVLVQGQRAFAAAEHLQQAFADSATPERVQKLAGDLGRALSDLGPDLSRLGKQLGTIDDQLRGVTTAFGPVQRRQLEEGVAQFRRAIAAAERISADLQKMAKYVEQGRGTLGGLSQDLQIFDELKETHRLIKRESWRLLFKQRDKGQRDLR